MGDACVVRPLRHEQFPPLNLKTGCLQTICCTLLLARRDQLARPATWLSGPGVIPQDAARRRSFFCETPTALAALPHILPSALPCQRGLYSPHALGRCLVVLTEENLGSRVSALPALWFRMAVGRRSRPLFECGGIPLALFV